MIDLDMMYKDSNWGNDPKGPDNITILMPGGRGWFNALLCHAGIDKKRPAVLLLHGFPGNDKNLDFGLVSKGESLHNSLPQYNNPDRLDSELMDMLAKG